MTTALIILAAGKSARLGSPKQLLPYRGKTLLQYTAQAALSSSCSPVIVVVGAFAEQISRVLEGLDVRIAVNHDWSEGMGSSLRAGIDALKTHAPAADAVIVTVCDQPFITASIFDRLEQAHRNTGAPVVASVYNGVMGAPALFDLSLFPELACAGGDAGARKIIQRHAAAAIGVPFAEGNIDIDTKEDFERLIRDTDV